MRKKFKSVQVELNEGTYRIINVLMQNRNKSLTFITELGRRYNNDLLAVRYALKHAEVVFYKRRLCSLNDAIAMFNRLTGSFMSVRITELPDNGKGVYVFRINGVRAKKGGR